MHVLDFDEMVSIIAKSTNELPLSPCSLGDNDGVNSRVANDDFLDLLEVNTMVIQNFGQKDADWQFHTSQQCKKSNQALVCECIEKISCH